MTHFGILKFWESQVEDLKICKLSPTTTYGRRKITGAYDSLGDWQYLWDKQSVLYRGLRRILVPAASVRTCRQNLWAMPRPPSQDCSISWPKQTHCDGRDWRLCNQGPQTSHPALTFPLSFISSISRNGRKRFRISFALASLYKPHYWVSVYLFSITNFLWSIHWWAIVYLDLFRSILWSD